MAEPLTVAVAAGKYTFLATGNPVAVVAVAGIAAGTVVTVAALNSDEETQKCFTDGCKKATYNTAVFLDDYVFNLDRTLRRLW